MTLFRTSLAAAALSGVLALGACGNEGSKSVPSTTTVAVGATAAPGSAVFSDADVAFAQEMIPHHEQAIEMADIALDPSRGAGLEVKALAEVIRAGQEPEIALMKGWLAAWSQPEMGEMEGHDMSSMQGMMSVADMEALERASGAAFDAEWLKMMIKHHEGAVSMAKGVQSGGQSPDVRALAEQVIAAQTKEIAEMRALLSR
jgi:uncharacterized protein (DUF305 family)